MSADGMDPEHTRPPGTSDTAVEAAGRMSEALETALRAQGHLYAFHQLMGHTDLLLDEVLEQLREAGADRLAEDLERILVGRNVVPGRWTFQLVEEFEDGYMSVMRDQELTIRTALTGGRRHVHEAEMKERRRTHGLPGHEAEPG